MLEYECPPLSSTCCDVPKLEPAFAVAASRPNPSSQTAIAVPSAPIVICAWQPTSLVGDQSPPGMRVRASAVTQIWLSPVSSKSSQTIAWAPAAFPARRAPPAEMGLPGVPGDALGVSGTGVVHPTARAAG